METTTNMISVGADNQAPSSMKRKAQENELESKNAKRQFCEIRVGNSMIAPIDVAFRLFQENGFNIKDADLLQQLPFTKPTPEMINEYQPEKIGVVRKMDLEGVRALHSKGESFDACNRFGESLIHMACRRGCKDMVEFLVREVKVSLFIRDDYGRTCLHDAFWTAEPNYDLVTLLISEVPEFLGVRDVRGHTPLDYVRKGDYPSWCNYLEEKKELLVPHNFKTDNGTKL